MNLFSFADDLTTGIDSIDEQHANVFELAERVFEDRIASNDENRLYDALTSLFDYVRYHFAAEERLMRDIGDPGFEAHRGWHDLFQLELGEIVDAARHGGIQPELRGRLRQIVRTQFQDHIRAQDRQLAALARATLPVEALKLADSVTLKRAGDLMVDVPEQYATTGTVIAVGE